MGSTYVRVHKLNNVLYLALVLVLASHVFGLPDSVDEGKYPDSSIPPYPTLVAYVGCKQRCYPLLRFS